MTVALSRARLGLYVLGRRQVFEACQELAPAFSQLLQRLDKLMLVTGEMWPAQRDVGAAEVQGEVAMEGVEHLGQFVFEMTKTRMEVDGRGARRDEQPMVGVSGNGEEKGGDEKEAVADGEEGQKEGEAKVEGDEGEDGKQAEEGEGAEGEEDGDSEEEEHELAAVEAGDD
jgi:intron-binding protein aquarius